MPLSFGALCIFSLSGSSGANRRGRLSVDILAIEICAVLFPDKFVDIKIDALQRGGAREMKDVRWGDI